MKFKATRKRALKKWLEESKRIPKRNGDDDFNWAYECDWQVRSEEIGVSHCALFCGIGEWAGHITDILSDKSHDHLKYRDEQSHRRIFRVYSRLAFVIAEILGDFASALRVSGDNSNQGQLRDLLGPEVQDLHIYVNKVVKHKATALHKHDHHLPLCFDDVGKERCGNAIKMGTKDFSKNNSYDCICVPTLTNLLDILMRAYENFHKELEEPDMFKGICNQFA